jgi:hypothetical protein
LNRSQVLIFCRNWLIESVPGVDGRRHARKERAGQEGGRSTGSESSGTH